MEKHLTRYGVLLYNLRVGVLEVLIFKIAVENLGFGCGLLGMKC